MKKKKIVGGVAAGIAVVVMATVWITMFVRKHEDIFTAPVVGIMALQAEEGTAPTADKAITINFRPLWTPEPYGYLLIYELTVVVTGLPPERSQKLIDSFCDLGSNPLSMAKMITQKDRADLDLIFTPPFFLPSRWVGVFFKELAVEIVLDPLYYQPKSKKTPEARPCPLIYYPPPRDPFPVKYAIR